MIQHMVRFLHVWHILFPRETKQVTGDNWQWEWHCPVWTALCEHPKVCTLLCSATDQQDFQHHQGVLRISHSCAIDSLFSFLFFCSTYGAQSKGQQINHHGTRLWPKGGGEEGWTSLDDRLDLGSPISCTGILKEVLWTSHTLTYSFWACVCCSISSCAKPLPSSMLQLLLEKQNESPWGDRHCSRHGTLKIRSFAFLETWNWVQTTTPSKLDHAQDLDHSCPDFSRTETLGLGT